VVPKVVMRADDAGSFLSANVACREVVKAGTIKNLSLMACGPHIDHAADLLRDLDCDFGVHVCLSAEWDKVKWGPVAPIDEVRGLVDSNEHFTSSPRVLNENRTWTQTEIATEVRAQIARLRNLGFRLTYLDEHMGVGWVPGIGEVLSQIAEEEGLFLARKVEAGFPLAGEPTVPLEVRFAAGLNGITPEVSVYVAHPGGGEDMDIAAHIGLKPGQVRSERAAETSFLTGLRCIRWVQEGRFIPLRYSEVFV
jgi:chitin disaccharide deacetylase